MGVSNKTVIPLTLVGYEMIIANETRLSSSYPTRARGSLDNADRVVNVPVLSYTANQFDRFVEHRDTVGKVLGFTE